MTTEFLRCEVDTTTLPILFVKPASDILRIQTLAHAAMDSG